MKDFLVGRRAHWMGMFLLVAVAGCGGDSPTDDGGGGIGDGGGSGGGDPVATTSVNVVDLDFTPPDIQVTPGATVTWTWTGSDTHNVTFAASSGIANSLTQTSGTYQVAMPTATGVYTVNSSGRRNTSRRSCDGGDQAPRSGSSSTSTDAFTRPSAGGTPRASAEVLGRGRSRSVERGGRRGGRCVPRCRGTLVSRMWWHATPQSSSPVAALSRVH